MCIKAHMLTVTLISKCKKVLTEDIKMKMQKSERELRFLKHSHAGGALGSTVDFGLESQ